MNKIFLFIIVHIMFSNKLIWSIVIIYFLFIFSKYLGFFAHGQTESFTNNEKDADVGFNIVYSSNGGYPDDGIGPEIYVNNRVKNKWSESVIKEFLRTQAAQNQDVIFNMDMIQLQATQKEAEELINTGMWPWSQRTKEIYADAISRSTISKKGPLKSMNNDRTIYNENAILQMIALNDKEGEFLIEGARIPRTSPSYDPYSGRGTYGLNSGLISDNNDLIQCNKDKLVRVHSVGNDGITGAHVSQISDVDYNQLPKLVKGFKFIKQPCNPCVALNSPADYTCPFSIKKKGHPLISFAWEKLWGLAASPIPKLPDGFPYWMN
jgi:hypothetical protein